MFVNMSFPSETVLSYGDKLLALDDGSGRCSDFVGAAVDLIGDLATLVKTVSFCLRCRVLSVDVVCMADSALSTTVTVWFGTLRGKNSLSKRTLGRPLSDADVMFMG